MEVMRRYQRPGSHQLASLVLLNGVTVLLESHDAGCECSYCREMKFGLLLPESKHRNSWRILRWRWGKKQINLRWILPRRK